MALAARAKTTGPARNRWTVNRNQVVTALVARRVAMRNGSEEQSAPGADSGRISDSALAAARPGEGQGGGPRWRARRDKTSASVTSEGGAGSQRAGHCPAPDGSLVSASRSRRRAVRGARAVAALRPPGHVRMDCERLEINANRESDATAPLAQVAARGTLAGASSRWRRTRTACARGAGTSRCAPTTTFAGRRACPAQITASRDAGRARLAEGRAPVVGKVVGATGRPRREAGCKGSSPRKTAIAVLLRCW